MPQSPLQKQGPNPDLNSLTDEQLMGSYRQGEERAFEILYARHSSRIYGYLLVKLKDRILTDDIFQGTFLKLHRTRDRYDESLPFLPWLFTICKSVMVDTLRSRSRHGDSIPVEEIKLENELATVEPAEVELAGVSPVDFTRMPLSQDQRQALELRYLDDASFQDIADRLKTSPSNARQLVSRAVQKVRRVFEKKSQRKGNAS